MASVSTRWAVFAGGYAFLFGAALILPLGVVVEILGRILGLSARFATLLVPASGAVIGAAVWWAVVERRGGYKYHIGGVAGLMTGVFTVLFWALLVAIVYGPKALVAARVVVAFVLAVAVPVAFVAGVPLMYARLRLDGRSPGRSGAAA